MVLSFCLAFCFILNLSFGQVAIPLKKVIDSLFFTNTEATTNYIILNFRLPKALVALLVGVGLSVSGLLMQTFFKNPLAGPYVLGLSSGSSLGVALIIMGSALLPDFLAGLFLSNFGILIASVLGSLLVLILIFLVSNQLKNTAAVLIVGLMFSSFTSAFVSVLTYFSTAEQLQKFTFWTLGNLSNLSWNQIILLAFCVLIGLVITLFTLKNLDAFILGDNYVKSLGINLKKQQYLIFAATGILAGSITAFVGPIAFVGLAIPHIAKLIFQTSNHKILFIATMLLGGIIMLLCDTIAQLPGLNFTLPINAITSILGAPVVIWLLIKKEGIS